MPPTPEPQPEVVEREVGVPTDVVDVDPEPPVDDLTTEATA